MPIHYLTGDATQPIGEGVKIIVHICNDIGGWGAGFVLALSKHWRQPEEEYRNWYKSGKDFVLGEVLFVQVGPELFVANLIGQQGIRHGNDGTPPIRYEAIAEGLKKVTAFANANTASVHMPRIGCGLAGGKWEQVEPIILDTLIAAGVEVTVYDF